MSKRQNSKPAGTQRFVMFCFFKFIAEKVQQNTRPALLIISQLFKATRSPDVNFVLFLQPQI
jgi:hypothetical protein